MKTTQICSNCGREFESWQLEPFNIGKSKSLLCAECMKNGRKRVDQRTIKFFQMEKKKRGR